MPRFTEEELEEKYQPYDIDRSMGPCGYTDGYVETDMDTCIPVCVLYNEDNLAKIGLNVNRITGLGNYDAASIRLADDCAYFESQYGMIVVAMATTASEWNGDDNDDDESDDDTELEACCGADIENPEWQLSERLFDVYAPVPVGDADRSVDYNRACWNAAMRLLRNFAE